MRKRLLYAFAGILVACNQPSEESGQASAPAQATNAAESFNPVMNPGFEDGATGEAPPEWLFGAPGFTGVQEADAARTGAHGLAMGWTGDGQLQPGAYGTLVQNVGAAPFRGQRVRLAVAGRMASAAAGYGQLWLRVDSGPGAMISISNSDPGGRIEGQEWADHAVYAAVPVEAQTLAFGLILYGQGPVHLDDFSITAAGDAGGGLVPPAALSAQALENLAAFARLYGYVRYFHPSDEAANAEWDRIALAGVEGVESATSPGELRSALLDIFMPLAPTLHILDAAAPAPELSPANGRTLAWRRTGLGEHPQSNIYGGERIIAPAGAPDMAKLALPGGMTAYIPLQSAQDADGDTVPLAEGPAPAPGKPDGFLPTGDDRTSRLASVVIAWNILQHFYPYWDEVDVDWPAQLRVSLARAAEDPDAESFDETMELMVAAAQDGHGNAFRTAPGGLLPVAWQVIEGEVVITGVADRASDARIGDVVTAIDGQPIDDLLAQWRARAAASTPGWRDVKALQLIARGAPGRDAILTVERAGGQIAQVTLAYTALSGPVAEQRPKPIVELEPGVVYVDLTRVTEAQFMEQPALVEQARGLIFDMRGYPPGGGPMVILPHLTDAPITSAQFRRVTYMHPDQQAATFDASGSWNLPPRQPRFAAERVAFLTDARAISYAESIMGIVEAHKLGEIVGTPTAGTNGNIDRYVLPTRHTLIWTGMHVLKHDGSPHHGVGVLPTIPVEPTINGIRAGRDEVLEAGIDAVRG